MSLKEIYRAKTFFEKESSAIEEGIQGGSLKRSPINLKESDLDPSEGLHVVKLMGKVLDALNRLNGKGAIFVIRALLRLFFEDQQMLERVANVSISSHLYRLFIVLTNNDLTRGVLTGCFGVNSTHSILLTLFEIALFNKQAISSLKSGALMFQREKLSEYFTYYEQEFVLTMGERSKNTQVRLFYAMMYYAFEIKNNMHASINYFQKLQATKL